MADQTKEIYLRHEISPVSSTPAALKRHSFLERCADAFKPARSIALAWTSALLTLLLLILTALYASQATFVSGIRLIYASSSRTIFVLRVLSELTGVFLACTIAAAFERIQWLLVVRKGGVRFTDFHCLQSGTGVFGLLSLAAERGVRTVMTRAWSVIRLTSTILVPVLGVVIMSDVQTKLAFHTVHDLDPSFGFGMRPFNASVAQQLASVADLFFLPTFGRFLIDPARAVDITPAAKRGKSCSQGADARGRHTCERAVFVPGGVEFMGPRLVADGDLPEADVYLTHNQQGYVFRFEETVGDSRSDSRTTCHFYGSQFGFRLCLPNSADDTIYANILQCPSKIAMNQQCTTDTSWHSLPGWSTTLRTSFRNASVAFSRLNGTIFSYTFSTRREIPAPVSSSELFRAYNSFFGNGNDPTEELLSLFTGGGSDHLFVKYVWALMDLYERLGKSNPAVATRNVNALQELLTIPLYFCQSGSTGLSSSIGFITNDTLPEIIVPMESTRVSLSTLRYELVVSPDTIIAYVALTALALGLCFATLAVASVGGPAKSIPETTLFPVRDFCVNCDVKDEDERFLEARGFGVLGGLKGSDLLHKMDGLRVMRRSGSSDRLLHTDQLLSVSLLGQGKEDVGRIPE